MSTSRGDIIGRQRLQASLSAMSQELKPEAISQGQLALKKRSYWEEEVKSFSIGYNLSLQYLKENPHLLDNSLTINDFLIHLEQLQKHKISDLTLQKLLGKSSDVMLVYYHIGQIFFEEKNFIESQNIFTFLTVMNQFIPSFWIARGAANESLEDWNKALGDYWMAQSLDPENLLTFEALIRIYKKFKDENALASCYQMVENYPKLKNQLGSKL